MTSEKKTVGTSSEEKNNTVEQKISRKEIIIRIEITNEITGYTIQGLKGINFIFSDPAIVVPTYKTNIFKLFFNGKTEIKRELISSFNVTRDAWYYLGEENKEAVILNREFIPKDTNQNLYGAMWIPHYPTQARIFSSGADAFIFTRFGSRKIPARPLATNKDLNNKNLDGGRSVNDIATDVMIHIGGTYELYIRNQFLYKKEMGRIIQHLGGSYGCFAFIPESQIRISAESAKEAINLDQFDDKASNRDWDNVCNIIKSNSFPYNRKIQILLHKKTDSPNDYLRIPTKEILEE